MFVGLRRRTNALWFSYEMWDITSVNMVYVDNLGPPDIRKTLLKFWWNFRYTFYENCIKKNYPYFYIPNCRKITINAYESMGRYTLGMSSGNTSSNSLFWMWHQVWNMFYRCWSKSFSLICMFSARLITKASPSTGYAISFTSSSLICMFISSLSNLSLLNSTSSLSLVSITLRFGHWDAICPFPKHLKHLISLWQVGWYSDLHFPSVWASFLALGRSLCIRLWLDNLPSLQIQPLYWGRWRRIGLKTHTSPSFYLSLHLRCHMDHVLQFHTIL